MVCQPRVTRIYFHIFFRGFYSFSFDIQVCDPLSFHVLSVACDMGPQAFACEYSVVPVPFIEKNCFAVKLND